MTSVLIEPFRLHDLTLKNRIVLSPMTRGRAGTARLPNRLTAEYYAQRSAAGLLVTDMRLGAASLKLTSPHRVGAYGCSGCHFIYITIVDMSCF